VSHNDAQVTPEVSQHLLHLQYVVLDCSMNVITGYLY